MTPIPCRTRVGLTTSDASAWVVAEGKPKPLTSIALTSQMLTPISVAAMMVVTEEACRDVSASGQSLFNRELKGAVTTRLMPRFSRSYDDATAAVIDQRRDDATAIRADLRAALMAVPTGGNSALFWVVSDVAKAASTSPENFRGDVSARRRNDEPAGTGHQWPRRRRAYADRCPRHRRRS